MTKHFKILSANLILFFLHIQVFSQNTFLIPPGKEGIYSVKNVFKNFKNVYLKSENIIYKPYYDSINNLFYGYFETNKSYHIIEYPDSFKISTIYNPSSLRYLNTKYDYHDFLVNATVDDHWVDRVVNMIENYSIQFSLNEPLIDCTNFVMCRLYNYEKSENKLTIEINDSSFQYTILHQGIDIVKIPVSKYSNFNTLKIKPNSKIAIVDIYTENKDLKIRTSENTFIKSSYTQKQKIDIKDDFFYFTFSNGILKKNYSDFFDNIIVQSKKSVTTIPLKLITNFSYNKKYDYVVIADISIFPSVNKLIDLIKKNDSTIKKVLTIRPQQIYDLYSCSNPSANAIKEFLHRVKTTYVLLIGDANVEENNPTNLIPTVYYQQEFKGARIGSDYMYSYFDNPTDIAFSIGRIPIVSNKQLENYVHKLISYKKKNSDSSYLIYDDYKHLNTDSFSNYKNVSIIHDKTTAYDKFLMLLVGNINVTTYLNSFKPSIFQYVGHSSIRGWSHQNKTLAFNIKSLQKNNIYLQIELCCSTGKFYMQTRKSFTEKCLLYKNKGPIASITPTGYTLTAASPQITKYILEQAHSKSIGQILNKFKIELFKQNILSIDDIHSYNILGIPSLKLY